MGVKKKTLSFPEGVWSVIEDNARLAHKTPSAYVSELIMKQERIRRGLAAVDEWEAEHGPISPETLAWADRMLDMALDPRSYEVDEDDDADPPAGASGAS
jgi:hypothetical protein